MSVYKELLHGINEIKQRETVIFKDACDYGIPIKSEKDPIFGLVRGLKEQYNPTRKVFKFSLGSTVKLEFTFYDEWDTKKEHKCVIEYTRQLMKKTLHGKLIGILHVYTT